MQFIFSSDNREALAFVGNVEVKYVDVFSEGEGFPIIMRLSGVFDAEIERRSLVFKSTVSNYPIYPIRGHSDNDSEVAYRTDPKCWMDTHDKPQRFPEQMVKILFHKERHWVLFISKCYYHNQTDALRVIANRILHHNSLLVFKMQHT